MSRPITITLHCPCCDTMFESLQLKGNAAVIYQSTDFYRCFEGNQPVSYMIHTCPECGYSGYKTDFDGQKLDEQVKRQVKMHITPLMFEGRSFSGTQYEYAAMIAQWKGESNFAIGELYLRAAWCHHAAKSRVGEKNCRMKAITFFELGLDESDDPDSRAFYAFLAGELHRRLGNSTSSAAWFDESIVAASKSGQNAWIKSLAEQQKTDPRDVLPTETKTENPAFALI